MVTSRFLVENLGRLRDRHYALASAHLTRLGSLHVAPTPQVLKEYRERFGPDFALILYKTLVDNEDFYVVPFARIEALFSADRATSKDGAWNVQIADEALRTAEDHSNVVHVAPCHGSEPLSRAIVAASVATPIDEGAMRRMLRELAARERPDLASHAPRRAHPIEPMKGEVPMGMAAILDVLDATPTDRNSLCRATGLDAGAGAKAIAYLLCTGHAVQVGTRRGARYARRAGV